MSLSKGLGAVLRSARSVRGLSQQDLGDAADPKHLWLIESAKSSPTLNKLDELATALGFDPLTLLTLTICLRDQISPTQALARVEKELEAFASTGQLEKMLEDYESEDISPRARERATKLAAVQECKRQGLTQKETIEKLGIPRSTVNDLWKLPDLQK